LIVIREKKHYDRQRGGENDQLKGKRGNPRPVRSWEKDAGEGRRELLSKRN